MSHTTAETLLASAANENIPVSLIVAGLNDRTKFNPVDLKALADNIEAVGLAQPPLYRRRTDGRYQIIAGERRTRAMRDVLGWQEIPARVVECDDMTAVSLMGAENRNRVNLDPMDDARSYQNVMALYGWDVAECARRFGVNTRVVKDRVALLALCDEAQDLVSKGENGLTLGYALVLALAGLDRNFQNQALDLLKLNKAPTLDWFRGIVAELQSKCNQNMMWNPDDFMVMAQAVEAQNEAALPDPDIAEAPTDGATPIDVLTNQAAWWLDLAAQWQLKNKAQARVCRANARNCKMSADLIARMAPAPVVMAPVVEVVPVAPVALPDDIIAVEALTGRVGRRTCDCGQRATHELVRRVATGDGQRKSLVKQDVCNSHLPAGFAPLVGAPAQQLTFQAVAA